MEEQSLKTVLLTGGGSGGHVTPLVVVAKVLRQRNPNLRIIYIGDRSDAIAQDLIKNSGVADIYHGIYSGKLRRYSGFKLTEKHKLWKSYLFNIRDFFKFLIGLVQSLVLLLRYKPQVVFSKGGYPALPVCIASVISRRKIVTHDSDAVPGLTHKLIRKYTTKRLVGVPTVKIDEYYVGVPVSPEFNIPLTSEDEAFLAEAYGVQQDSQLVLVTGGGLGAIHLNNVAIEALVEEADHNRRLVSVILTGEKNLENAKAQLRSIGAKESVTDRIRLVDFSSKMAQLMRRADIVVSRAGATAMAELAESGAAAIVIANPQLPGGHQIQNANSFGETILQVEDKGQEIDTGKLWAAIHEVLKNDEKRKQLSFSIREYARPDAVNDIVGNIIQIGDLNDQV